MTNDERPPFGHPDFYAPISHMLRDAAKDADCHAYSDELLFAADEIERLQQLVDDLTSPDDCRLDHHGICQTHYWLLEDRACPHGRAKQARRG